MLGLDSNQTRKVLSGIITGYSIGALATGQTFEGVMCIGCLSIIWYSELKDFLPDYMYDHYEEEYYTDCEDYLDQGSINVRKAALDLASVKEIKKLKLPSAPAHPRDERQREGLLIFMDNHLRDCSYFSTENVLNHYGFKPIIVNKSVITRKLKNTEIPVLVEDRWWQGTPTSNTIIQRVDVTGDLCADFEHI